MTVRLSKLSPRDQENLLFLLTAGPEKLEEWYNNVDSDDHAYAKKLLLIYDQMLDDMILMHYDDVQDVTEAEYVLKGIMRK